MMAPDHVFKYPNKQREFAKLHPELIRKFYVYKYLAWVLFGDIVVITEIFRNKKSSTHYWYRAIDIAILERGGIKGSEFLRGLMNKMFPYGDDEHETVPKLRHGTGPHTHLQQIATEDKG